MYKTNPEKNRVFDTVKAKTVHFVQFSEKIKYIKNTHTRTPYITKKLVINYNIYPYKHYISSLLFTSIQNVQNVQKPNLNKTDS